MTENRGAGGPPGWATLVKAFDDWVSSYTSGKVKVVHAKEKFGALRVECNWWDADISKEMKGEIFGAELFVESLSMWYCQECGGTPTTTSRDNYNWIRTMCDECRNGGTHDDA